MIASSSPKPSLAEPSRLNPKVSRKRLAGRARRGVTAATRWQSNCTNGYLKTWFMIGLVSHLDVSQTALISMDL
jgi:hypothetical protein